MKSKLYKPVVQLLVAISIGVPVIEWLATGRMIQLSRWEHVLLGLLALGFLYEGGKNMNHAIAGSRERGEKRL